MSGILKWFAFDKFQTLVQVIKANGGLRKSLYTIYRTDDLKVGDLIGRISMATNTSRTMHTLLVKIVG